MPVDAINPKLNDEFEDMLTDTEYSAGMCGFCKTTNKWGEFSNMHRGFPLQMQEIALPSSEHLYQALKFTDPAIQKQIIRIASPMECKKIARLHQDQVRVDWNDVNLYVMDWVLARKAHQHPRIQELLLATGHAPIVELNFRGTQDIWSARPLYAGSSVFNGCNVLGKMLERLRNRIKDGEQLQDTRINWRLTGQGWQGTPFLLTEVSI